MAGHEQSARLRAKRKRDEDMWMDQVLPTQLIGDLVGVLKSQSPRTGDYFVECEKVHRAFGCDAKVRLHEMPRGFTVGSRIMFELVPPANENSAPLAKNVRHADVANDAGADSTERRRRRSGGAERFESSVRMVGIVKRSSAIGGRRLVFCPDISDVYGQDAQVPAEEMPPQGLKVGDRVSFDVEEPLEGLRGVPLARKVALEGAKASVGAVMCGGEEEEEVVVQDIGDGEDDFGGDVPLEEVYDDEEAEVGVDCKGDPAGEEDGGVGTGGA